ncbi:MAG: TonB-dependent receptor [Mangrovibacterium sp.]
MKLTLILSLFAGLMSSMAESSAQSGRLNLKVQHGTVKEVIEEIERQTDYSFMYDNKVLDISRPISVNVENTPVSEVMDRVVAGQNLKYEFVNRFIVVSAKNGVSNQQQVTKVSGKVTSEKGEPLPGVTVLLKGTSTGTVTDFDGNYSLSDIPQNATLVFSFVGMQSQEIVPAGQSQINVQLKEESIGLEEVVAIGYGTVKRADLTGAVASVKGDELAATPVANVTQAMQGRLLGVNVTSQDGRPGATISVRVRGGGSITQSNEPLYIVDGFPVGTISDLPASEIESIDVLKDASSTAIYGARGANGVILVTTKSGKEGKVKVAYDGFLRLGYVPKTQETLSAQDYVLNSWSYAASRGTANRDAVEKYFGLGSNYGDHYEEYAKTATHDYTDDLLRTALTQSHYITMSGGAKTTKISSTLGYIDEEGVQIRSDYKRWNGSLKLQQDLSSKLKLDIDLRYTETNSLTARESGAATAYTYRPIDNPLGGVDYTEVASGFSFGIANIDDKHDPVELTNDITRKNLGRTLRASGALSWEIMKGLTARSEFSVFRGSSKGTYYENGYTNNEKRVSLSRGESEGYRSVTTLNYKFNIGEDNAFTVLLGNEVLNSEGENTTVEGRGYPDTFDYETAVNLVHTATNSLSTINSVAVPAHTISYFGRINYSLKERYLLTATVRADGSSKFGPNNKWGYFPAAALAWRVSDEAFLDNTKNWLSNLKLRLSYGASGADNISSNLWRETWSSVGASNNHTPINGEFIPFYRPDGLLANPDLKWETTISRNVGIDYGFMDNRINGTLEVYWNTTKDLLMAVPVDNTTGYSYQFQNFGKTSNRGFELSVNADIVKTNDFNFNLGVIYNYNLNKLDDLPNAEQYLYSSYWASVGTIPTNDFMFIEGKPIGIVRGYISEGFYTVDDFNYTNGQYVLKDGVADISNAVTQTYMNPFSRPSGQNAFPGAAKFKDIDDSGLVDQDDATNLGSMIPKHTGSFQLNFNYKQFDLSSNFTWVLGGKVYNVAAIRNTCGNEFVGIGQQRADWVADAYKVYDVNASGDLYAVTNPEELEALNAGAKYHLPYHQSSITSSEWLESGSYLRLQTLSLGYSLPSSILQKLKINRARFYVTASNLFTITGYSGLDPEVNVTPTGQSGYFSNLRVFPTPNMDNGAYPRARTFTFGTNITF